MKINRLTVPKEKIRMKTKNANSKAEMKINDNIYNLHFMYIKVKYMLLLVYIYYFNKPHNPITGLTYISNTQPQNTGLAYKRYVQNTGLAYMRYVITPDYRVSMLDPYSHHNGKQT